MRHLLFMLLLSPALPVAAQEPFDPTMPEAEEEDLFSDGARSLLERLLGEVAPALRELEGALGSFDGYFPPEMLPNGDIIIRRRTPLVPQEPPAPEGDDAIDL
jgi:hypothetical protein